ncbi:DUF397 domain-containing protein [Streptomyces sp. NBC_01387]|nr:MULTISPECIES: DUF397 domain-containing protein [unclassified Streptomyces]WSV53655.1 DUF397 domain-containing protein [Streptomyces sp. NBC_01014]
MSAHPRAVRIRDSKPTDGPVLTVAPDAWAAFLAERRPRHRTYS